MPRTSYRRSVVVAGSAAIVALIGQPARVAGAAALPATHVTCGQLITQSIRVANNLSCAGPGLVLGAAGITLDLGGHRFDGIGTAGSYGISSGPNGPPGVTIRNGVVQGFERGIFVDKSARSLISDLLVIGNTADGIKINDAPNVTVTDSVATGNGAAAINVIGGSSQNTIAKNILMHNGDYGIHLESSHNAVSTNVVVGGESIGIRADETSAGNSIARNRIIGNYGDGLRVNGPDNLIERNFAQENEDGITLTGAVNSIVRKNVLSANQFGIFMGIGSTGSIEKNVTPANDEGIGIYSGGSSTVVSNVASENEEDGIFAVVDSGTLVKNVVSRNGFRNGVVDGVGLGIDAPLSAIGSGNKAFANDNPAQCSPATLCVVSSAPIPVLVVCGQTISTSIKLLNSLRCTGNGLVVGASGITIDLNGHLIHGNDAPAFSGIDNTAGHDGVKVKNGVIIGFEAGVALANTEGNTVTGLVLRDNAVGVSFQGAANHTVVTKNVIIRGVSGIDIEASSGNVVKGNTVVGTTTNGIVVTAGSTTNVVSKNTLIGNGIYGLRIFGSTQNVFAKNRVLGTAGYGIRVEAAADDNTVAGNVVTGSLFDGVFVESSARTTIAKNHATASKMTGITVFTSTATVVKGNTASSNSIYGINVNGGSANAIVSNTTNENALDGIISSVADATIAKNTANGNGFADGNSDGAGLGIAAAAGTAGSSNKTKGNDDADQCDPASLCE